MKKVTIFLLILISSVSFFSQFPDKYLHVIVCDVGQGDGILITKGSTQVVIDGGPNNAISSCIGSHIPFWDRSIELLVNTHADLDHYFGFVDLLKRYKVQTFLGSEISSNALEYVSLQNLIREKKIEFVSVHSGQKFMMGESSFDVLFPTREYIESRSKVTRNDFSAIIFLKYKEFTALFTGDTSPSAEKEMLGLNLVSNTYLLKVPHHGSRNGLTQEFLSKVSPIVAAISVGRNNRFNHPSPEVIDMLSKKVSKIYRTDKDGDTEFITDGTKVWVSTNPGK